MAWTSPITWVNGAVTAATMNAEVRDHFIFLKAAMDLLTNSTTTDAYDSGTGGMYVQVRRGDAAYTAFESQIGAATNPMFRIQTNGKMGWGAGGASALDTFMERVSGNIFLVSGGTTFRVENAANTYVYDGRITLASYANFGVVLRTDTGGEVRLGDGTSTYNLRIYDDATNDQSILGQSAYDTIKVLTTSGATANLTLSTTNSTSGDWLQFYRSGGEIRWLSGSSVYGSLSAPSPGTYVQTGDTFGLWGRQGVRTFTRAGTIADGNFGFTPSDGHTGVDTLHDLLYARSGGTWMYADLQGSLTCIGPFVWSNLRVGTTDIDGSYGGFGSASMRPPIAAGVQQLDGSNPTPVATGLGTITAAALTINIGSTPGDDPTVVTYTVSGDTLNIWAWKTNGSDPTLVASTDSSTNIGWVAVGNFTGTPRVRTGFAGDYIAIAARSSQNFVAGSVTIKGNIAGTTTTNLSVTLNSSAAEAYDVCDPGDETFSATSQIGMTVTDVGTGLDPDFMDVVGHAFVLLRRV